MAFGRRKIQAAVGTATASDVLSGFTFSSALAGVNAKGLMPNQGQPILQPGQSLAAGYYSGGQAAAPGSGSQTFSTPGPFSFVVPSGVTRLTALLTGAGGGGGGDFLSESQTYDTTSLSVSAQAGNFLVIIFTGATDNVSSVSGTCTVNGASANTVIAYTFDDGTYSEGVLVFSYTVPSSGTQSISLSVSNFQSATAYSQLFVLTFSGPISMGTPTASGMNVTTTSGGNNTFTFTQTTSLCILASNGENDDAVTPSWSNLGSPPSGPWSQMDSSNDTVGAVALAVNPPGAPAVSWLTYTTSTDGAVAVQIPISTGGGGGGAINLIDLIGVLPGYTVTGTVGAGGTSGSSPTAGGNTTLTVGTTTWTANGGRASSSSPDTGGAASTQAGVYLSSAGQSGTAASGGAVGSLNGQVGGGAGATSSSAPGIGGGGIPPYNGGDGQVVIRW